MEQSHPAVKAKPQKAPTVINVVVHLMLSTNALQMTQSAILVGRWDTTSVCVTQAELCMVYRRKRNVSFLAL